MLRHAGYPEEKCVRACVSTVSRVAGSPCSTRIPNITNFQSNFWLCLNLNSLSWYVQPFTHEEIVLGFSHVAATTQKTVRHDTRNTKINESRSSCS